nr:immunoglobulin heavy chain junction region [Mus musculus]
CVRDGGWDWYFDVW